MLIFSVVIYGGLFLGAEQVAAVFNSENNEMLQKIAVEGIRLYFIACPFAGFNIITSVYFTSGGNPGPANIMSVLRGFLVIIPMAFLLSRAAGIVGTWCAFPVTEAAVAALGAVFYFRAQRAR